MKKIRGIVITLFNLLGVLLLTSSSLIKPNYSYLNARANSQKSQAFESTAANNEQQLNPNGFSDISIANGHIGTIVSKPNGEKSLSMWGNNDVGQVGNKSFTNALLPQDIYLPKRDGGIDDIILGDQVSGAIAEVEIEDLIYYYPENCLYLWGGNNKYFDFFNQPSNSNSHVIAPRYTKFKDVSWMSELSFGKNHYGVLGHHQPPGFHAHDDKEKDLLLMWGDNSKHQIPGSKSEYLEPVEFHNSFSSYQFSFEFKELALGDNHSGVIATNSSKKNMLFLWGDDSLGQIGIDGLKNNESVVAEPTEIRNFPDSNIKKFEQLTMGSNHTGVVADLEDGKQVLYMWGDNQYGQVGNGKNGVLTKDEATTYPGYESSIQKITLPESKIKFLRFDHNLSSAVTVDETGKDHLYLWGQAFDGSILANEPQELILPFDKIKSIDVSKENLAIVALDENGKNHIYLKGDNHFGQIGLGHQNHVDGLQEITNQENKYIESVNLVNNPIITPKSFSQNFTINFADDNGITANYVNLANLKYELTNLPEQATYGVEWSSSGGSSPSGTLKINNLEPNHTYKNINFAIHHKIIGEKFTNNLTWNTKQKYTSDPPQIDQFVAQQDSITQNKATLHYQITIPNSRDEYFSPEVRGISVSARNIEKVVVESVPKQVGNVISGEIFLSNLNYGTKYLPELAVNYFNGYELKTIKKLMNNFFETPDNFPADAPTISDFAFKQIDPMEHQISLAINLPKSKPHTYDLKISRVELLDQDEQIVYYFSSSELITTDNKILVTFHLYYLENNTTFSDWKLQVKYKVKPYLSIDNCLTYAIPNFTTMDKYPAFEPSITNSEVNSISTNKAQFNLRVIIRPPDSMSHSLTIEKLEIKNDKGEVVGTKEYHNVYDASGDFDITINNLNPGLTYKNWVGEITYFNGQETKTLVKTFPDFETRKLRAKQPIIEILGKPIVFGNQASLKAKVELPSASPDTYQAQIADFSIVDGTTGKSLWTMQISPSSTQTLWSSIPIEIKNLKYHTRYSNLRFLVNYFDGYDNSETRKYISLIKTEAAPSLEPVINNALTFNDDHVSLVSYSLGLPITMDGYYYLPTITKIQIIDSNTDKILGEKTFNEGDENRLTGKIELSQIEDKIIYDNVTFKVYYNDGYEEKSVSRKMESFIGKNEEKDEGNIKKLSAGAIAGISVGAVSAFTIVILIIIYSKKRIKS